MLWAAAAILILVLVFHLAGGWYFASQLDSRALSAAGRRDALQPNYDVEVRAVGDGAVTLWKRDEARLGRDGTFGLLWDGGWGTIGAVLEQRGDGSVVREFTHRSGGELATGMRAEIDTRVYQGDPLTGMGLTFEEVAIPGEVGDYPAWYIPGKGSTWFIFIHGNGMTRRDGLRMLPAVAGAGLPILVPAYRGAEGAPDDPSGRLSYGKREWRDVEATVQYALDHGAESIVIEGMSMGGGIVTAFMLESPLASRVSGLILDAPVLDFGRSVDHQAAGERLPLVGLPLPGTLVTTAKWFGAMRFGVDWGYTSYLDRVDQLSTPILLIHGTVDDDVPFATSEDLARLRPDLVRDFYGAEGAAHVEAWNIDPGEYDRRVVAFLQSLGAIDSR